MTDTYQPPEWACNGSVACNFDLDIHGPSCNRSNGISSDDSSSDEQWVADYLSELTL